MEEVVALLFVVGGVGLFLLALPIAAMVVASRARRIASDLQDDLFRLRAEVRDLRLAVPTRVRAESSEIRDAAKPEQAMRPAASTEPGETGSLPPLSQPPAKAPSSPPTPPASAPEHLSSESPRAAVSPKQPLPPSVSIDWERWFGVRGAAVLGGCVLALAGLLFFRYSIERGWLSPEIRVVLGVLAGVGGLIGAERMRGRYSFTPNALAGGAVVILYGAFWAAKAMYGLIPMEAAFVLMALTTAVACLASVRHHSLLIAVLGLMGGFATPLLLSSGSNRPIGLFGYALLLDAGFLFIAFRRRWGVLALLALVGTSILQVGWIAKRMEPNQLLLALGILALFAVVFAAAISRSSAEGKTPQERRLWAVTQGAALLLPYAFALYFASSARFGQHFSPLALLLGLLGAAAAWVTRRTGPQSGYLAVAAAGIQLAVVTAYLPRAGLSVDRLWELVGCCLALAASFHLFAERSSTADAPTRRFLHLAAAISTGGLFALLSTTSWSSQSAASPVPYLAAWLGLGALGLRLAVIAGMSRLQAAVAAALAVAVSLHIGVGLRRAWSVDPQWKTLAAIGVPVAFGALLHFWARLQRDAQARLWADRSTSLFAVLALLGGAALSVGTQAISVPEAMLGNLLIAAPGIFSSTRARDGRWMLASVSALAVAQTGWGATAEAGEHSLGLAVALFSALLWTYWPVLAGRRTAEDRFAVYAATLSAPLHFWILQSLFKDAWGNDFIAVLPLSLGGAVLGAMALTRKSWTKAESLKRGTVWFAAAALGFVSVAIPLQLDRQWITLGWAMLAVASLVLWRRLDHEGLKWFAICLLGIVFIRLIANPAVLDYAERGPYRIFNWMLYAYLVPAACLLYASRLLRPLEVARARPWEKNIYEQGVAWGASLAGMGGLLLIFVWLNLAVFDFYADGPMLTLSLDRMPARDLTLSLVWLTYAGVLLALGMWKKSKALRWTSLVFMLVSTGKVFLYDLGTLNDLHRVASLLGLAVSLLLISVAYQRFVFRRT